jgi:hypothetical protein
MKLVQSLRKNRIVSLMWTKEELISLISSARDYIHNDDGSISSIYDVQKQVIWDFCHGFSMGVVSPRH